jgi:coenzyme F420-reducing hydrogenase delta subunit
MRLNYPTNVKIVKVPCTGRVDILLILKAFESGVDGIYLAGCLEGECHFLRGNLRAKKRVQYVKTLLEEVGLGGGRVEMYNMSSAQGQRFAEVAREMTEKIKGLGPSPVKRRGQGVQGSRGQVSIPENKPSNP